MSYRFIGLRTTHHGPARIVRTLKATLFAVIVCGCVSGYANGPLMGYGTHSLDPEGLPTGTVSDQAAYRGVAGYEQMVEIRLPEGAQIAPALPGAWDQPQVAPLRLGLQVGHVWRFRLSHIPFHDQAELYPTLELFDRLYTPETLQNRFPLRIELTQSDLDFALAGKLVVRVIYLEDPETAIPVADAARGEGLGSFDVAPGDDPMAIADLFGRPLAIVRIGGRSPIHPESPDAGFTFGATPYVRYPSDNSTDSAELFPERVCDLAVVDPSLGRGEYLLNGGDRELREHGLAAAISGEGGMPAGLDTGDAVATFESMDGEPELVVINRVPLYAPRLGCIRKLVGLTEQSTSVGWRDMEQKATSVAIGSREVAATRKQHESPRGAQSDQKASSALGTEGLNRAETAVGLAMHRDEYQAWENFQRIRTGETDAAEGLRLSASTYAARSWEQPEELKVFFGDDAISSVATIDTTSEVYFVDKADKQYGKLQVTKVASTQDAAPGETVEFTIRYDNIGEAPIVKVRIADSLSPRLEYVDGSAESSIPSQFKTVPNEGGSVILEWELDQPLLPGEGGIVRFKTLVR